MSVEETSNQTVSMLSALYTPWRRIWGVSVYLHTFLTRTLYAQGMSPQCPSNWGTVWAPDLVEVSNNRKITSPCRNRTPDCHTYKSHTLSGLHWLPCVRLWRSNSVFFYVGNNFVNHWKLHLNVATGRLYLSSASAAADGSGNNRNWFH